MITRLRFCKEQYQGDSCPECTCLGWRENTRVNAPHYHAEYEHGTISVLEGNKSFFPCDPNVGGWGNAWFDGAP